MQSHSSANIYVGSLGEPTLKFLVTSQLLVYYLYFILFNYKKYLKEIRLIPFALVFVVKKAASCLKSSARKILALLAPLTTDLRGRGRAQASLLLLTLSLLSS